jgi:hypothetical protein
MYRELQDHTNRAADGVAPQFQLRSRSVLMPRKWSLH